VSDIIFDPRPLDPPEYFDHDLSSNVSWVVNRYTIRYNKSTNKFTKNVSQQNGDDDVKNVLQMIAEIYSGDSPENCEIFIDATQTAPRNEGAVPVYFQVNFSETRDVYWEIKQDDDVFDSGTDSEEFFATVEYMINEQKKFHIELGTIDPTPHYLYDNSGGEPPLSADEIYKKALDEKREAWS
jgi:hypothetical protein